MKIKTQLLLFILFSINIVNSQAFSQTIDAATHARNHSYFFQGSQYYRFTEKPNNQVQLDAGYPRQLPGGWQGLTGRFLKKIDAALYYPPNGKTYLFSGNQYVRLSGIKVDQGYPRTLPGGWQGMPKHFQTGIDATVFWSGHTYFFKDKEYVRFSGLNIDQSYPQLLPGGWQVSAPFNAHVDAAFRANRENFVHFFADHQYAELEGVKQISGYPIDITDAWPGVHPHSTGATADPILTKGLSKCGVAPKLGGQCWTTEDIIDRRIDHHAQNALMAMLSSVDTEKANIASALLCAVKQQNIRGIYLPAQQVPAKQAIRAGSAWWKMITPATNHSACYKKPNNEPSVVVFKKTVKDSQAEMSRALTNAWNECDLVSTQTLCYSPTISRPPTITLPPQHVGTGSMEVVVLRKSNGTNTPAAGANVSLSGPTDFVGLTTNNQGLVLIENLATGKYQINAHETTNNIIPNAFGSSVTKIEDNQQAKVTVQLDSLKPTVLKWSIDVKHPQPKYIMARNCTEKFGFIGSMHVCQKNAMAEIVKDKARIKSETMTILSKEIEKEKAKIRRYELQSSSVKNVKFISEQSNFDWLIDKTEISTEKADPKVGSVGELNISWALQGQGIAWGTYIVERYD